MIENKDKLSVRDVKDIHLDIHSIKARTYTPVIIACLQSDSTLSPVERKTLSILETWDYAMDDSSSAAAVFEAWYLLFYRSIFADEMGDSLYINFVNSYIIFDITLKKLWEDRQSQWFDNSTTPNYTEGIDDCIRTAFSRIGENT
jgi:acyl-homoserine lactone acylase PvdQ